MRVLLSFREFLFEFSFLLEMLVENIFKLHIMRGVHILPLNRDALRKIKWRIFFWD